MIKIYCKECPFYQTEQCGDRLCGHHDELFGYEQGRADAIEEMRKAIMECNFGYAEKIALDILLDRLKENR